MAEGPSYEEAREELIAVVQKLETGGTSLQESIELWERGEELARICQRWLDGARARLEAVVRSSSTGTPGDAAPPGPAAASPTDTASD
ncbi:MAG: exodeoxyribonuclease VII small subunit [Nocardioidaceae bacterium]|nr:exodeoxyribonuclease VII small subunit [Nocardioidaceae bacterium]